jgi:hypothetical protein
MARRVETFTADTGRDAGKQFQLTEMSAYDAEWWFLRLGRAAMIAGVTLPTDWENASLATLAPLGIGAMAVLPEGTFKTLLDEMFACVKFKPENPKIPPQDLIDGAGSQIEEVKTRLQLRKAWFYLHTGFSPAADSPTLG